MAEKAFRGDRLKRVREQRGWSQRELTERIGLNLNQISRYELGNDEPGTTVLKRLAQELGVTTDWLVGLVDDEGNNVEQLELTQKLTPEEERFLEALRSGHFRTLLGMIQQALPDEKQQSRISDLDVEVGIDGNLIHPTE